MKKQVKICLAALVLTLGLTGGAMTPGNAPKVEAATAKSTQNKGSIRFQYSKRKEFKLAANQIRQGDKGKVTFKGKKVTNVKWSSSRPSILTVSSNGVVKAKREGTATVVAKYRYRKRWYKTSARIQVVDRWTAEQRKFPSGTYWNNGKDSDKVTSLPCDHSQGGGIYDSGCHGNLFECEVAGMNVTGYQCHGFALKVANDVYGNSSMRRWRYNKDFKALQVGDVVRLKNQYPGHTIIVTKVFPSSIQYADCNALGDCQIQWGKPMLKSTVSRNFDYSYSRK